MAANAQQGITPDTIQDSIVNQLGLFPQEKIHVHTDRNMYVPGEKIWFKAYVVDAFSHTSPTYSQYAYIELIDSSDSLVHRVMVSQDGYGLFHGHIFLSEFVPEGDYTLRAYTRNMENLGEDYFFSKPVRINNLKTDEKRKNRSAVKTDYEVSFYPEGGYAVEGVQCRVAFKALNSHGASEDVTGEVTDRKGNFVASAGTVCDGMGWFNITPEAGNEYYMACRNQNGQEKRFRLPVAQKTYAITAGFHQDRHLAAVKKSPDMPEIPLFLLAHCRGQVLHFARWNYRNTHVSFPCDMFPSGVIQLLLFDSQLNPISERLIFNKNDDQATLAFSTDRASYQKRENVLSGICVTDREGRPLAGHVSVAVTDDRDVPAETHHTILSSLLLSSELRGTVETPGYYLQDNPQAAYSLDLLMMTHGWRRYNIPEAIRGRYALPETEYEAAKSITGTVRSLLLGRPVANSEVVLASSDKGVMQAVTDSAGLFCFHVHFPDSVKFFVQALSQKGKPSVELALDAEKFPATKHIPASRPLPVRGSELNDQTDVEASEFLKKAEQRAQYDEDMRLVQLPEVVVKAYKIEKRDEARLAIPHNIVSDITIYREKFERRHPAKVSDIFFGVNAGIDVAGNGTVIIRGSRNPLIVIDGMMMPDDFKLNDLHVLDIDAIDIFKGPSATIFGSRGGEAAISITTRRASSYTTLSNTNINFATCEPLGYQPPVAFYSPKYDTPELKLLGTPDYRTTIFWKPDLVLSDDGKASFDFYTSDFPTTYSVVIEGITDDGRVIRRVERVEIRV